MDKMYDAIVIGAGNGGLVSAITLQKEGKKVLLLEQNNVCGGCATSFVRGRFEFEVSLHELCDYGDNDNIGEVQKLFIDLGVNDKISFEDVPDAYTVYCNKESYTMPFGIENYISQMENYVPGSSTSVRDFFDLAKECIDALSYISSTNGQPDENVLKSTYANFTRVAAYNVDKVLNALKMPKKAQEILTTYWVYLGSPISKLSFVHYAIMVYKYIALKAQIPLNRSYEISMALAEKFASLGGEIQYNTKVKKIIVKDNKAVGVVCENGKEFESNNIICNINPNIVYGQMISNKSIPQKALKLANQRQIGARGFCVYLGLNKSCEELGIDKYSYFIYSSMDSEIESKKMQTLDNDTVVAVCLNKAIPNCSPEGTTLLYLTSLYLSDCFDEEVNSVNYFNLKENLANLFIDSFENATDISIRDYIEEVEIATPVTFARYINSPQGSIYGYQAQGDDNLLSRMVGMHKENYIKGLHFCGGSSFRLSGFSSAYLSGYTVAKMVLNENKEGK